MSEQLETSPLPWRATEPCDGVQMILSAENHTVAIFEDVDDLPAKPGDPALIVRSANAHADLLAVARMAMQPEFDFWDQYLDWHKRLKALAAAAIERAEGTMSERSKHTPGPWVADGVFVGTQYGKNRLLVYDRLFSVLPVDKREEVGADKFFGPESTANALLIAAAPEMYSACDVVADVLESFVNRGAEMPHDRIASCAARLRRAIANTDGGIR